MNKKIAGLALLAVSSVVSQEIYADNYFGADIALVNTEFSDPSFSIDFDTKAIQAKIGTYVNEYFAVEARLGFGISDDDLFGLGFETKSVIGAYARAIAPVNDKMEIYGIAGLTELKLALNGESDTDSDISFGAGINVKMDSDTAINFEYINLYDDKDEGISSEISSFNIGFTRLF